jgi:hypothetical protein
MNFVDTYNMFFFHVLILKVVHMHFTPSFVVLKESKCMCTLHNFINPLTPWIEVHEYFDGFINLCTLVDAWCIIVSRRYKI